MAARKPLVVYLQYTNPAGYPPLEHSSKILAREGFEVLFLGAAAAGADQLAFPASPGIEVRRLPGFGPGLAQRINYFVYIAWCAAICALRRPRWIYASELLSCPAALLARAASGASVVYHEHDSPIFREPLPRLQRLFRAARRRLARVADICVLPQARRLAAFVSGTGRAGPSLCVWNCPEAREAGEPRDPPASGESMSFYYHGSINADRLPPTVLDALARAGGDATLSVVGYAAAGSRDYMTGFLARAEELGLGGRVRYLGALDLREEIIAAARQARVGLAFMPRGSGDINMDHMAGASNKPFDYMAAGQFLLVSRLPEWVEMFVDPGHARACDPFDVDDLANAMRWCVENPAAVHAAGEAGRGRIASEWNYERGFEPVLRILKPEKSQ